MKKQKSIFSKIIVSILALLITFTTLPSQDVQAATKSQNLEIGKQHTFSISKNGSHSYNVVIPSAGRVDFEFLANVKGYMQWFLYDSSSKEIASSSYVDSSATAPGLKSSKAWDLESGTYTFVVNNRGEAGKYGVKFNHTAAGNHDKEPNNTIAKAQSFKFNTTYTGFFSETDAVDIYKLNMAKSARVQFDVISHLSYGMDIEILDNSGVNIISKSYASAGNYTTGKKTSDYFDLEAGTYYLRFKKPYYGTGRYKFKLTYKLANNNEKEPNNNLSNAQTINLKEQVNGFFSETDKVDYYKFALKQDQNIQIDFISYLNGYAQWYLYDSTGKTQIDYCSYLNSGNWDDGTKRTDKVSLKKGTYYLKVNTGNDGISGKYSIKLSSDTPEALLTSFKADKNSGQNAGSTVKFTATSDEGSNTVYQFHIKKGDGSWETVQKYSSKNYYNWKPTEAGTYTIRVWAKHKNSKNKYDSYKDIKFTINSTATKAELTGVNMSAPDGKMVGKTIKFTANSLTGSNTLYEFYVKEGNGSWSKKQAYSSKNYLNWKPTKKGRYTVRVRVKDKNSKANYDDYMDITLNVK